jgi:hypothetical protein
MLPGNSIASLEQLSELLESGMGSGGSRAGRHPAAGPRRS